jgi:hypothetical protein
MLKPLIFSLWLLFHPVHVTLTSIDYIPKLESYKVFVKMYFDDFLNDCRLTGVYIDEGDFSVDNSSTNRIVEKYLSEKLVIKENSKILKGKLLQSKLADNELSIDMEYAGFKRPKSITVQNLIMTHLYSDMSNMIIVRVNDFEKGVKMTSDMTQQIFNIK